MQCRLWVVGREQEAWWRDWRWGRVCGGEGLGANLGLLNEGELGIEFLLSGEGATHPMGTILTIQMQA